MTTPKIILLLVGSMAVFAFDFKGFENSTKAHFKNARLTLSKVHVQGLPGGLDAIAPPEVIDAARAAEQDITETRVRYESYFNAISFSITMVRIEYEVVVGHYWCCTPATVQDRCSAGAMCPQ